MRVCLYKEGYDKVVEWVVILGVHLLFDATEEIAALEDHRDNEAKYPQRNWRPLDTVKTYNGQA